MREEAAQRPGLWAIVQRLALGAIEGGRITMLCPPLSLSTAQKMASGWLAERFTEALGRSVTVLLQPSEEIAPEAPPATGPSSPTAPPTNADARSAAQAPAAIPTGPDSPINHPLVKRVQEVLSARVVRVRPRTTEPVNPAPPQDPGKGQ